MYDNELGAMATARDVVIELGCSRTHDEDVGIIVSSCEDRRDVQSVGNIVFRIDGKQRKCHVSLGLGDVRVDSKYCREGSYADAIRIHPDRRVWLTAPSHVEEWPITRVLVALLSSLSVSCSLQPHLVDLDIVEASHTWCK